MRVATTVGSEIKWVDVTNVYSSDEEPEVRHRMVGDLWLDTDTGQLMVYGTSGWASVAAQYLPIDGGTMEGDIQMDTFRVYSQAPITSAAAHRYAYVNRDYIDGVQTTLQTQIDDVNNAISDIQDNGLDGKVSIAGDEMTGILIFGDGTAVPSNGIDRGIDMNGNRIIRVSSPFSPTDYLIAGGDRANDATTRYYVAQAFQQHLADESHGAGGFIQAQGDGTGLVPNTLVFNAGTAGTSYALKWFDVSGNNQHQIYANFSGPSSQLILEAGTDSADTVDIRHGLLAPTDNPLFRFGNEYARSFKSIYIHDGQPQPIDDDLPTALNDDNKVASKGFVRQWVADNLPTDTGDAGTTVTSVSYAYNDISLTYTLTLVQDNGVDPINVNMYHKHSPYDIAVTHNQFDLPWFDFDNDLMTTYVADQSPDYPETSVGVMLDALVNYKAPVEDAIFNNLPRVGIDTEILEYNTAAKTIRFLGDFVADILVGMTVKIDGSSGNDGLYTTTAVAAGALDGTDPTTVVTVAETLAFNGVETADAFLNVGAFADPDAPRALVTRTTLDYELNQLTGVKYQYYKAATAGTNVVRSLSFSYTPGTNKLWVFKNGQKLRVGIVSGGDFNETSTTSITIATVAVDDEFEIYEI